MSVRNAVVAAVVPRIRRVAESPEMVAIQKALPPSFIGLAFALAAFMIAAQGTLTLRFTQSFGAAFGVMSVVLVIVLTALLAKRRDVPQALALVIALAAFALSLPYDRATSFLALAKALGSSGLFLAIGISLVTVVVLRLARERFGARAGSLAGGLAIVAVAAALLRAGISLTAGLDAAIAPLGHLGDSLEALLVITLVETLLWTIGIHGPALLAPVVLPVYFNLQIANTEAAAHHDPLPHVVTVSMFLFVFPGGAGATLPLVLLFLRSRVKRLRRVALATVLPSLCNANEPLMFGLPLVLNPTLGIPFVVAPLVLAVVSYEAIALGFVNRPVIYVPSTVPIPIGTFFATGDWRSFVLMAIDLALALAIYAPFARAYERREGEREREHALATDAVPQT